LKKGEINMAKKEERFEVTFRDGSGYYTSSGFRRKSHSYKVKSVFNV